MHIEKRCPQAPTNLPLADIPHARHAYKEAILSRACSFDLFVQVQELEALLVLPVLGVSTASTKKGLDTAFGAL